MMGKKDDEKKKITHDKMIRGQGQKMKSEDGRLNKREMRGEKWTLENNVRRKMSRRSSALIFWDGWCKQAYVFLIHFWFLKKELNHH